MNRFDEVLLNESLQVELDETSSFSKECVYFIKDVNTNYVKVGRTSNIGRRFKQLQEPSVVRLEIFHLIYTEDSKILEKDFHQIFRKYHQWGEVFDLPISVLDTIKEDWE